MIVAEQARAISAKEMIPMAGSNRLIPLIIVAGLVGLVGCGTTVQPANQSDARVPIRAPPGCRATAGFVIALAGVVLLAGPRHRSRQSRCLGAGCLCVPGDHGKPAEDRD